MNAAAPFDDRVADEASAWLVLLSSGDATDSDRQAWTRWRDADPEHDRAWRHIESINQRLRAIPARIADRSLAARPSTTRRRFVRRLPVLLLAGGAGLVLVESGGIDWRADHRTGVGEQRRVVLPDGTTVVLNTASALDVLFDSQQRTVALLRGEAWIETVDDRRPFTVRVGSTTLRALGTRFMVRRDETHDRLLVLEGAVRIERPGGRPAIVVGAGRQTRFTDTEVQPPTAASPGAAGWVDGVLVADRMRLDAFLAELQRYRRGFLRCDPAIAGLRVSGVMPLTDTDQALQALRDALPVEVVRYTRYWVTVTPRR